MASYNGEKYIEQQLESILSQTYQQYHLLVTDDCSTDGTWKILQKYEKLYPEKLTICQNSKNSGSSKYNFMQMMLNNKDNYLMLCDQDDIWLPQKIEKAYTSMQEMEKKYGKETPLLVHTDLVVVDENLDVIEKSFQQMIGTAKIDDFKGMILQTDVTGCTVLYNYSLAKYLNEMPKSFVMHDWWLAMVCAAFGKSYNTKDAEILYRQHGGNVVGAQSIHNFKYFKYKLTNTKEIGSAMMEAYKQAKEFLGMYGSCLSEEQKELLCLYAQMSEEGKLARMYKMISKGLLRKGFLRSLSQLIYG